MVTALGVGPQFYDQDVGFAPKPDTILGEGGNDTIFSSTLGGSLIDGGTDNDILQSRGPGDTIIGNAGNDSIRSQQLRTLLLGNQGRDTLSADLTASLYGGVDRDFLIGQSANNYLFGNKEEDTLLGGIQGGDFLYGGASDDLLGFVGTNGQSNLTGVAVSGAVGGLNQGNNYVSGDKGRDSIVGINNGDTLLGGDDNDSITGVGSLNFLDGGSGNDTVRIQNPLSTQQFSTSLATVGVSQTTLLGGAGDDSLYGGVGRFGEGQNYFEGGDGNDTIRGFALQDALYGGEGNDLIVTANPNVLTIQGSTTQPGFTGENTLYGGGGNDTLLAAFSTDYLYGDAGNDSLSGKFSLLEGGDGNDTLYGGDWTLQLPGVTDRVPTVTLSGGAGNDYLHGAFGSVANLYNGGLGDDTIVFTTTNDSLLGEGSVEGNDKISFVGGLAAGATGVSFVLFDTLGNNTISGSDGNDSIVTGSGTDFLQGGSVATPAGLAVGFGDDTLVAGGGNDYLFGGSGSDVLFGEAGNDTLQGGTERDTLVGGEGSDVFLYQFKSDLSGTVADIITDFNPGEDKLFFSRGPGGFAFELRPGVPTTEISFEQFIVLDKNSYNGGGANTQAPTTVGPVLVYEKASGVLWYDSDGGGSNPADIVAFMARPDNTIPTLTRTDIVIVL
ncbi:calcium-binding protein [Planktothrix paucivesiculata]|uniref:Haemolysin-type calcium-binding toxin, RTX-like (Expressed) n=1 Tax=Planktothrix paucivesiculata PCC 9631 TaxID=671071 RepID=A0A7Z9BGY0_9CYAN|nr:calcium-binding protein [Planktothrix paucivesiculata]VXD10314.1 putative haemolysin-type calcium-binding toxin, RTX-like (Expressed) [Planktothrix paucivesiculata PCC 9631]